MRENIAGHLIPLRLVQHLRYVEEEQLKASYTGGE
jgi:hypothetical protein